MAVSYRSEIDVIDLLSTLLKKLFDGDYSSPTIKRHRTIQEHIQTILKSDKFPLLATTLYKELSDLLNNLPPPGRRNNSFQALLWPRFHEFRVKHVPQIWHTTIGTADPILMQRASLDLLIKIIELRKKEFAPTVVAPGKQEKRAKLSFEEQNATRYVAGYVLRKLKKKYSSMRGSLAIWEAILGMEEDSSHEGDEEETDFLSYTRAWIDYIDKGGLYKVKDEVYLFLWSWNCQFIHYCMNIFCLSVAQN